jgi:hypothetical protein
MSFIEHERTGLDEAEKFLSDLTLQMCGGDNLDLYLGELVSQGQSQCSNTWSKGVIAYRCRTCQMNDSRSAQTFVLHYKACFSDVKLPMDRALSLHILNLKAAFTRVGEKSCRAQQLELGLRTYLWLASNGYQMYFTQSNFRSSLFIPADLHGLTPIRSCSDFKLDLLPYSAI